MLYAVNIEPFNATFFVSERPDDDEWEVQEGVELDLPFNYGTWPHGAEPPRADPLHFCIRPKTV